MNRSFDRRSFLQLSAFSLGCGSLNQAFGQLSTRQKSTDTALSYGPLRPIKDDATGLPLLELPEGFRYVSYGWTGDQLEDGSKTPGAHDGMAVIEDDDGVLTLCRNHELSTAFQTFGSEEIRYDPNAG